MRDGEHRNSAAQMRSMIARGEHDPLAFRAALVGVPPSDRDAWLDAVCGLGELPDDGPELPQDGVPYLPCSVDVLLRMVDQAPVGTSDVFVDVGAGVGRAATLVHLLTGAAVIGLEVQPALVRAARDLAAGLHLSRISFFEGDAIELAGHITLGSVFFLYCPFSGDRLTKVLASIEPIARARTIRVCCVDLPLPPCSWLTRDPQLSGDLAIYRSTLRVEALEGPPSKPT